MGVCVCCVIIVVLVLTCFEYIVATLARGTMPLISGGCMHGITWVSGACFCGVGGSILSKHSKKPQT